MSQFCQIADEVKKHKENCRMRKQREQKITPTADTRLYAKALNVA